MKTPPKFPLKILRLFCSKHRIEELEGDLYEEFQDNLESKSFRKSQVLYLLSILRSFKSYIFDSQGSSNQRFNSFAMFQHYLKTALRGIRKNKAFALINILGLSIGFAITLVISLFLIDQSLMDDFFPEKELIVRLEAKNKNLITDNFTSELHPAFATVLSQNFPEIDAYCRLIKFPINVVVKEGSNTEYFQEDFIIADSSFFTLFPFEILLGDFKTKFISDKEIIITEKAAKKYFGTENPIGKIISAKWRGNNQFIVAGVIKNIPKNSSLQFDFLILNVDYDGFESGAYSPITTYFKLSPKADRNHLLNNFKLVIDKTTSNKFFRNEAYNFTPYKDLRFNLETQDRMIEVMDKRAIIMFGIVAVLILLLATINYINLSASRALQRGQEAGIRKIIGAGKGSFMYQFLTESLLICLISLPISVLILETVIPYFESVWGQELYFDYKTSLPFFLVLFSVVIGIGIIAGLYPALLVSRFKFSEFIKGNIQSSSKGVWVRKGLIIFQMVVSIMLILGSIIVQRQLEFIQAKTLGYNPEQIIVVERAFTKNFKVFKESLNQIPEVMLTSITTSAPGGPNARVFSPDKALEEVLVGHSIDENYLELLGLELVTGENFDQNTLQANENTVLINETMAKLIINKNPLNVENPLLEAYHHSFLGVASTIRGVIKDFHMESLHKKIVPMIFSYESYNGLSVAKVLIKIKTKNIPETLEKIEDKWQEFIPEYPFRAEFMDSRFENLYTAEMKIGRIFKLFMIIAIFISSLGLYGLISFLAETKLKEISIRKVLGASILQLVNLLTRDVYMLIIIASLIAIPVAYLVIEQWLDNFAYRTNISIWAVLTTILMALFISGITVFFKTYKTAQTNPVDTLRNE